MHENMHSFALVCVYFTTIANNNNMVNVFACWWWCFWLFCRSFHCLLLSFLFPSSSSFQCWILCYQMKKKSSFASLYRLFTTCMHDDFSCYVATLPASNFEIEVERENTFLWRKKSWLETCWVITRFCFVFFDILIIILCNLDSLLQWIFALLFPQSKEISVIHENIC